MLSSSLRRTKPSSRLAAACRSLATLSPEQQALHHKWAGTTVDGGQSLNLIGGEWTAGTADKWLDINDPSTQRLLSRVPETPHADMVRAVDKAEEAFDEWKDSSALRRQAVMLKCVPSAGWSRVRLGRRHSAPARLARTRPRRARSWPRATTDSHADAVVLPPSLLRPSPQVSGAHPRAPRRARAVDRPRAGQDVCRRQGRRPPRSAGRRDGVRHPEPAPRRPPRGQQGHGHLVAPRTARCHSCHLPVRPNVLMPAT